jgi:hypothetical protein
MMVKFISSNTEKYAVIYPQGGGLTLSILLHSTYLRERPEVHNLDIPNAGRLLNKITAPLVKPSIDISELSDQAETKLREYITALKSPDESVATKFKIRLKAQAPIQVEKDLLAQLMAM